MKKRGSGKDKIVLIGDSMKEEGSFMICVSGTGMKLITNETITASGEGD